MSLKKLSYRSESLLNIILNNLIKEGKPIEGKLWVKIPLIHLSKILKCTIPCVSHHASKLVSEGILLREQLNKSEKDHTNYYSINPEVLTNSSLLSFFNASIINKINSIYKIRNIFPSGIYISNHQTSQNGFVKDMAVALPNGSSANPLVVAKNNTANEMLSIWNTEFGADETISKPRARYLVACYQRKFDSSLEKWRDYVRKLKGSKFVMNMFRKLKSLISWALSFKVINCVFKGGFGTALKEELNTKMKDILEPAKEKQPDVSTTEAHINSLDESEACLETRRLVIDKFGTSTYMSWFTRVKLELTESEEIKIIGSSFIVDYIKLHYLQGDRFIGIGIIDIEAKSDEYGEPEFSQEDLISNGYVGASRVRSLLKAL